MVSATCVSQHATLDAHDDAKRNWLDGENLRHEMPSLGELGTA